MQNLDRLKVAIVHDQLTQYGGAEKTLETLLDLFPDADLYTGFCKPINISQKILKQHLHCGKIPGWLGFLMPLAFESFDLRKYNIVISEGTAWPKGVITNPDQLHISYIYTPPRFLYGYATEGQKRDVWYLKPGLKVIDYFLRIWDYQAAQRPDYIVSISREVSARISKYYRRSSCIIYPPVELPAKAAPSGPASEPYYLCVSRLAAYKNVDKLVRAFNLTGLNLKIAGTGKQEEELRNIAGPNVKILGFVSERDKADLLTGCKGFIFPTDKEDFGITLVEALSYGKPVLCHGSGGPLEIVEDGITGMYFYDLSPKELSQKIIEFDRNIDTGKYDPQVAVDSAGKYGTERFKREMGEFISKKWEEKCHAGTS